MQAYPDPVSERALELRDLVLKEAPKAFELIYDSYNALSTAYSFTDQLNKAFCHIALYSDHVNLGFNYGAELADPKSLLKGSGRLIRHLKIKNSDDIEAPDVRNFIKKAISHNRDKFPDADQSTGPQAIVKSISENKRRPG